MVVSHVKVPTNGHLYIMLFARQREDQYRRGGMGGGGGERGRGWGREGESGGPGEGRGGGADGGGGGGGGSARGKKEEGWRGWALLTG